MQAYVETGDEDDEHGGWELFDFADVDQLFDRFEVVDRDFAWHGYDDLVACCASNNPPYVFLNPFDNEINDHRSLRWRDTRETAEYERDALRDAI